MGSFFIGEIEQAACDQVTGGSKKITFLIFKQLPLPCPCSFA
jgi:hypothetical protein